MNYSQSHKIRIKLDEYKFEFDLKQRLLLNNLTFLEIEILKIIVNNSLIFPIDDFKNNLKISSEALNTHLNNLLKLNLFKIENNHIYVNKEIRKFLEIQLERFEKDFNPDLDYFLQLIRHIPIEILMNWFSISKTSDDIIESIIHNYFLTPELFKKYLSLLQFDDENYNQIINLLYKNSELFLDVNSLLKTLKIDNEQFELMAMTLEFHKICCLKYIKDVNGNWKRILIPFLEWKNYLFSIHERSFQSIEKISDIQLIYSTNFGFIQDLDLILNHLLSEKIQIKMIDNKYFFVDPLITDKFHSFKKFHSFYDHELISKLSDLKLIQIHENYLEQTKNIPTWLSKSLQEKGMTLYFLTIYSYRKNEHSFFNDRDIREIEKSLKKIIGKEWVYLEDFINSLMIPLGKSNKNSLEKKAGSWNYSIPKYGIEEFNFIHEILEKHLFYSGILMFGIHNHKKCISMTSFGILSLGD